jgi:hypothetical protein
MNTEKEMQRKSRLISVFLLLCAVACTASFLYVIIGIAKESDLQAILPSINLVNGIDRTGYTYAFASTILIRQLAIIAALVFAFTIFRKIGKGLSPFTDVVSKRIRTIGTLLIVAAIIAWPVGSLVAKAVWSDKTSYPIIINLDWGTLVFGFIISSLASIFRYGCVLQQASDETL